MNKNNENIEAAIDIYFCDTPDYAFSKTHFHNVHKIIFVDEGAVKMHIADKNYTVSGGTIVFISNLEKHSVKILRSPYKRYVVSLPQDFVFNIVNHSHLLSILMQRPPGFSHAIELTAETARMVREVLNEMLKENEQKQAFWTERLLSLAAELLILLYRQSSAVFPADDSSDAVRIVTEVQHYIVHNCQADISLESMAKKYFVNKYYLSRIFKSVTGYTFKDYLILHRLSVAKDLLLHTDLSVTEVCLRSGYNNVNHFIRIFKSNEGTTPYQYKKEHL